MDKKTSVTRGNKRDPQREDRLKAAMKANLQRRKAQARVRSEQSEAGNEQDKDS
jgi:hypothetical protein